MNEGGKSRLGFGMIMGLGCGGLLLVTIVFAVIGVMMYFSADGKEIGLRNQIKAQEKTNEISYDTTWKIISQKCQIKDDYKESFRSIYVDLMKERHYEAGGQFMKWIKEANPKFDVSLFKDLMNTISGERKTFERNQAKLVDLQRQHNDVLTKAPERFFVGGRPPIEIRVVTSTKTDEAFKSGKEDDVDLSPKKKEPVEKK